jgi:diguanylate cyclase (GGDEF)-like protein
MQDNPIDICIIEDDSSQLALLTRQLERNHYSILGARSGEEGLRLIRQHQPSVVICDLQLPGCDGIEVCKQVRTDPAFDGVYLLVLTACSEREMKYLALNAGADDYIIKPYDHTELLARVRNGFRVNRLQGRLRRAALTDGLTGLWNYAQFRQLLDREFNRTRRYGGVVSLLMLDLDHFKAVNDTYGHEAGNHVLKSVASQLLNLVRDTDIVARYGGEEFAVICPQTDLEDAFRLAERIRQTLRREVVVSESRRHTVTASIGVAATSQPEVGSPRELINLADHAMYEAKREGRDRVCRGDQPMGAVIGDDHRTAVERLQKQVQSLNWQTRELCLQSVYALVQALEARDPFTVSHSRNTKLYAACLAERAGWPESLRTAVANAALLHDLGKIGVPDGLLRKSEPLTVDELRTLREVPLITCRILEPLRVFETEMLVIRHLRERYDGGGSPDGLVGTAIPIGSRLLAVAEAFDALTNDRPHRPRRSLDDAVAEILRNAGGQFDPDFAELLGQAARVHRKRWLERIRRAATEGQAEAETAAAPRETTGQQASASNVGGVVRD